MRWNCSFQKRKSAISEKFQQTKATKRVSETFGSDENFLVERKLRSRNMLVVLTSVVVLFLISLPSLVRVSCCSTGFLLHILHIFPITVTDEFPLPGPAEPLLLAEPDPNCYSIFQATFESERKRPF